MTFYTEPCPGWDHLAQPIRAQGSFGFIWAVPICTQGPFGFICARSARPAWSQGPFVARACLVPGTICCQGLFGPRVHLGSGPVWAHGLFGPEAHLMCPRPLTARIEAPLNLLCSKFQRDYWSTNMALSGRIQNQMFWDTCAGRMVGPLA